MRKLVDTFVLVCLLVGPAVILTCVRQSDLPAAEQTSQIEDAEEEEEPSEVYVYAAEFPRP